MFDSIKKPVENENVSFPEREKKDLHTYINRIPEDQKKKFDMDPGFSLLLNFLFYVWSCMSENVTGITKTAVRFNIKSK